jgi:hypothetical protein
MATIELLGGNSAISTNRCAFFQEASLALGLACLLGIWAPVGAQTVDANNAPVIATAPASTQSAPAMAAATANPKAVLSTVSFTPNWSALTVEQKQSLQPLASAWDSLSDGHRRKWIALAKNYPSLAPPEQAILHSRMAEWAALKPRERERARLNFVETKKLPAPDRASNWEAYKALSPEERQKLAERAAVKRAGAAATVKPVSPEKLTTVPITRNTPQPIRELELSKQGIDRKTLLPIAPARMPVVPAPQD